MCGQLWIIGIGEDAHCMHGCPLGWYKCMKRWDILFAIVNSSS